MKKRKLILECLTGLLFMAFTAVNVTVSLKYSNEDNPKLSFGELVAKADTGREYHCQLDIYGAGICTSKAGNVCTATQESCSLAFY